MPHFIAMSGTRGCLPDFCQSADTLEDAVDMLCVLFNLGRVRRARLLENRFLALDNEPVIPTDESPGAEYCEIQTCSCPNRSVHDDC